MTKKLLIKKEKTAFINGEERVISEFEKHYVDDEKDFSCRHGTIRKKELKQAAGSKIMIGSQEFILLEPCFLDHYKKIKRGAQIITLKDIGSIITGTGINKNSVVVDGGSGSGALSCFLGMIAKKVISYDKEQRSLEISKNNAEALGLKNVVFKEGDIYDPANVKEKNIDVFILDVPEPWKAIKTALKILKLGGFLVVYLPNTNQVQEFVKQLPEEFLYERTIEVIEREWVIDKQRCRPTSKDYGHTGFLTFARKISS